MKLLLFSDLHLHSYKDFSRTLPSGRNSRLQSGLDVLAAIRKYAVVQGITNVLFGGDLFHKKQVLSVGMYQAVYEELEAFVKAKVKLLCVVGNHDQATLDGTTHAMAALRNVATVVDTPTTVSLGGGFTVRCVPYMEDFSKFSEAITTGRTANILLAHGALNGAVTGPVEYQPEHQLKPEHLPNFYDFMFFGHYHKRQQMRPKCWYIGSPMQHSRGEREEHDKGFLVYDTETLKFKNVPLGMPEFKSFVFPLQQPQAEEVEGHYVDVEVDPDKYDVEEVRAGLLKMGAVAVNVVPVIKEKVLKQRLDVSLNMSTKKLVQKYVEEYHGELDEAELVKRALKYLEGA
jgi:DNA repair exonuclease SbcCD nuclease subunit